MNYSIRIRTYVDVYTILYLQLCSHSMDSKRIGFVKHSLRLNTGRSRFKWLHHEVRNDWQELDVKRKSRKTNNRKERATV